GLHGRLGVARLAFAHPSEALVELLLAAEQAPPRHAHVVEDHLGGVAGPDAVLLELLALRQPLGARWHDEARMAPAAELGVDDGDHDVDVGDAAVGDPGLRAV